MDQPHDTEEPSVLDLGSQVIDSNLAAALLDGSQEPVLLGPFELVRRIGAGAMSLVFQAVDTRNGHDLALKILHVRGAVAAQRLKREFRALADIHHTNLVQLHELTVAGEQAFFTMELVHGLSILDYLRIDGKPDPRRLQRVFRQLVDAVSALHAGGMLHRDLKPSNILVEPDGRVVVLDFGLARTVANQAEGVGSGTPAYMAPERLRGELSTEPSDWYSVGVILHEALTGKLPERAAISVEDTLCRALLAEDPSARPSASELRASFGLPAVPEASSPVRLSAPNAVFIGREAELATLHEAYAEAQRGHSVVVYLHGEPGIGKTALAKAFIQSLQEQHELLVLAGRCYEHELIPYNAVDGLVDCLTAELEALPASADREQVAFDMLALEHIFPTLIAAPLPRLPVDEALDPYLLRQRAFAAFRALIADLSARLPLVVHLDDLQWGDADSAQLLSYLVQEPNPMRVLVIASYRSADAERSACVRALHEVRPIAGREIQLGPLLEESAFELARTLARAHVQEAELQALVRESAGSPLFLRSLIQHHAARSRATGTTLQQLLAASLRRLPASSRELLELVALATRPVERELLLRAAQVDGTGLIGLQRSGLLRTVNLPRGVALDTYHDRVREIVSASVDPVKRRHCHAQLAAAEALSPAPDPEFLAYQYERAGQLDAAARYAELAGDRASAALAGDRAAELYALALRCIRDRRPLDLLEKLANALAYAGRCAQAAPLYLELADAARDDETRACRLRLRATEMLLRRGQVSESVKTVQPLLRAIGVRYPSFAPEAMLSILASTTQLRTRRLLIAAPREREVSDRETLRRELCFVLGYRLALVDPLPGSALLLRSLVMAQRSGTAAELARTLACYAWILATLGWGSNEEHDRMLDHADKLVSEQDDPDVKAWTLYGRGMTLYTRGHFEAALGWLKKAHAWVAAKCTDAGWMVAEIEMLICAQYVAKGEVANLSAASEPILRHLRDSGNEFQSAVLGALRSQILVAKDQPEAAVSSLDEILKTWTRYAPAIINVWSKVNTLMYQGQPVAAWQTMQRHWPTFGRAGYKRVNPWSVALPLLESTVALACAQAGFGPQYIEHVERGIRWLSRQRADWAGPSALLLRAGLAHLRAQRGEAMQLYAAAAEGFEGLVMLGYSNIARMRQAELMEGPEAVRVREEAQQWFVVQGIMRPHSWMKMYAPIGYDSAPADEAVVE